MNMVGAQTIISHSAIFLPLHSHYLRFSFCICTTQSPPFLHPRSLSSLSPFRQRQIRWRATHHGAVPVKTTYDLELAARSGDEVGTWKVSGGVSHALHPKGQHFKQKDPRTSLQRKPDFHWVICCELQELLPPPKCIRISTHGCLS